MTANSGPGVLDGLELHEESWWAHDAQVAAAGFFAMLRRLPRIIRDMLSLTWQTSRVDTIVAIAATVISELFTAVGLIATVDVFGTLFAAAPTVERLQAALPAIATVVGAVVARAAFAETSQWARVRLMPKVVRAVDLRMVGLTSATEVSAFDDPGFHDDLQRVSDTATGHVAGLLWTTMELITGLVGLIAVSAALGVLHPSLFPLIILAAVPGAWASVRGARLGYQIYTGTAAAERRQHDLKRLMTTRSAAAEIRSYTMRSYLLGEFERISAWTTAVRLRTDQRQQLIKVAGDLVGGIAGGLVYLALWFLVYREIVPLDVAGAAVFAIQRARASTGILLGAINRCYESGLYYEDYLRFCQEAAARAPRSGGVAPPADLDKITVEDITFTYPSGAQPALSGVSMHINSGEIVALVGENGSGKTTLAKVIGSLYRPDSGEVTWGGVSQDDIDSELLRENIAVIAQDFTHWPLTARQNITIGRHDHPDGAAQLERSLAASGADAVVKRLPRGIDSMLDPSFKGGTELSGGQWQRIAVARGFYRDAPLLICDEPTASLDARSEHAIFETIRRHAAQRTVLMITHRLASVRWCDRIYVLEQGHVVEHGTHEELLALAGTYAEMYQLQAKAYAANSA